LEEWGTVSVAFCKLPSNGEQDANPHLPFQSQASSCELGKQLAEVEALLQKQDLLEAQISAHGEAITTIISKTLKVRY